MKKKDTFMFYDPVAVREGMSDYLQDYYQHKYAIALKGMRISFTKRMNKVMPKTEKWHGEVRIEFRVVRDGLMSQNGGSTA